MSTIKESLGLSLKGKDGPTDGSLDGVEQLAFYFSAHWCPPCKAFTPKLAECYTKVNASKKRWEIVFVSMDLGESQYDNYYGSMPWLAIPFGDETGKNLAQKYGVRGIPALIFVNKQTGEVINKDGRGLIDGDADGAKFPWNL